MKNSILKKRTQNYFGKTPQNVLDGDNTEWNYLSNSEHGYKRRGQCLVEQLQEYFNNTPLDVLEKELEKYDYLNEIGPYVLTDDEDTEEMSPLLIELKDFLENATPEELEENWKQLEKYSKVGPNALEFVKELEHIENKTIYKEK